MPIRDRVTAIILVAIACAVSAPASAAGPSYEGMWWNPNESGWGVNLTHQGDTIFATWFIFGGDGQPYWVVSALAQQAGGSTFKGDAYGGTGTPYTAPTFDPNNTHATKVGMATANFTGTNQLTLSYSIAGAPSTKSLTRQTIGRVELSGSYSGYTFNVGPFGEDRTTFDVSTGANGTFYLQQASFFSGTCRFTGTFTQVGSRFNATGGYQCSDFSTGTWTTDDLVLVDSHYLIGTFVLNGDKTNARKFMGYN